MRDLIKLVEDAQNDEPEVGAGEPVTQETCPAVLYHGTNPIAATMIVNMHGIKADMPVDGDEMGEAVCTTSDKTMARNFATEFARLNSPYDVGVVFVIDGKRMASFETIVPYHAETAGEFEYEYRIMGDVPRECITGIKIVGKKARLTSERFIEKMWDDVMDHYAARQFFQTYDTFKAMVGELLRVAS
jgi:hypothetical protein